MPEHTVLITGGAGHIGQELVPQLLATQKAKLVLPTRNAERMQSGLPWEASSINVAIEEGSIRDPFFIETIIAKHNVDTVFLCLTGTDELMTSLNILDAMQRSAPRIKHLVFLSACRDMTSAEGIATLMKHCSAAHVLVKPLLEQKIQLASFPWTTTIIGPTLFSVNDLRSKTQMLENGCFDEPLGEVGISRVATSDIALAVTNVITDPNSKGIGKKVMVGSLKRYTGKEVTALWSEAIGKPLYMATPDQAFEKQMAGKMASSGLRTGDDASAWSRDLRSMYEYFAEIGFGMTEEQYRLQVDVLGKEPEDYGAWVAAVGASWRQ